MRKLIGYRKITPENLALMSDGEFINANRALVATMDRWKEDLISSGWLTAEDIESYKSTYRRARHNIGKEDFPIYRKQTEAAVIHLDRDKLYPLFGDTSAKGYVELSAKLWNVMQHATCLSDGLLCGKRK